MSFISIQFLLFLVLLTAVYFLAPRKLQWIVLLAGSCLFYLCSDPRYMLFLLFTALSTWIGSLLLARLIQANNAALAAAGGTLSREDRKLLKQKHTQRKRRIVAAVCVLNFGVLCAVKYTGFLIENINALLGPLGLSVNANLGGLLLPLGISFYTFQAVGYLLDVYREKDTAERNFARLFLFLSFFPQIIQGPISRHRDLGHQLTEAHSFSWDRFRLGAMLILWGFFKKLLIADRAAVLSKAIFAVDSGYGGIYILFGAAMYSLRVYADFSGGMDIARGAAQILGIELPLNFERPYFSTTIGEFWRRWHITLGAWFRDYVFYPLSLSKLFTRLGKWTRTHVNAYVGKLLPAVISQFVVFFLIGVWHGASWRFIVFGFYHGLLIIGGILLGPKLQLLGKKLHIPTETPVFKLFQILRTVFLVCFGRIITLGGRLKVSASMIVSLFRVHNLQEFCHGGILKLGLSAAELIALAAAACVLLAAGVLQERGTALRQTLLKRPAPLRWAIVWVLLFSILVFGVYGYGYSAADFIYRGF